MRFTAAIDLYCADMVADGRFTSSLTERSYRATLARHAEDVSNRDPSKTNRDDVTTTLRRWMQPNTRSVHRSHLVSFYDWALETGLRKDNPARQTRRPRTRKPDVYRLTRDQIRAIRKAARPGREQRIVDFGFLTGLRAQELLGLQGRHLRRPGWVQVSDDIAKGPVGREVFVPAELGPTWVECAETLADDEYVLADRKSQMHGGRRVDIWDASRPMKYEALYRNVRALGRRAGIRGHVTPHTMRHAYGDAVTRFAGIRTAQEMLGHASVGTTEKYTGRPTLDEIAAQLADFGYGQDRLPAADRPSNPLVVPEVRLGLDYEVRDWERVCARKLAPTLAWLWLQPALRATARGMAHA